VTGVQTCALPICFSKADEIAIVFCGSKKSLASGAPIAAAILNPAVAGVAMIPLMVFHQLQLMACAAIAQRYAARPEPAPDTVAETV
jgi:sodium/bile acid cotransporter 7